MDDLDSVVSPEETFTKQGHCDGLIEGKALGFQDGVPLGYEKGYSVANEVGLITGYIESWNLYFKKYPEACKSSRNMKLLEKFHTELLELKTITDIVKKADYVKLKFKQISLKLGMKVEKCEDEDKKLGW